MRDARGRALTKRYHLRGGRLVKSNYPNVAEVVATEVPVDGIGSLAAALDSVVAGGIAAVIRGAPGKFHPRGGQPTFRLLRPQEGLAASQTGRRISPELIRKDKLEPDGIHRYAATWLPTFEDRPRFWLIFDVDRVPVPEHLRGDWVDEPEAAVEHVLSLLPEPFQSATCWWSISSSAAVPGPNGREVASEFKLKLAFWLSRALLGAEVKRWMAVEKAPVDPAVFGAVQLIYLARPGLRARSARPGAATLRHLAEARPTRSRSLSCCPSRPANGRRASTAAFGPVEGLDELREALRARLAGEPHVREHLLQAARAYVRQHGPDIDQAALVAALEEVAGEHRSSAEVAGYGVDRLVDHVVRQERAATWMSFGRPPPHRILPPYFGDEAPNLFREANRQRLFLSDWLRRNYLCAIARHEIAVPPRCRLRGGRARVDGAARLQRADREEAAEIKRRKAAITRRIRREVLAELGLDKLPKQGERTLVTGAQGTGKSRTCAETIAELPRRDLSIWWLVPSLREGRGAGRRVRPPAHRRQHGWRASCAAGARSIRAPTTTTRCARGISWSTAPPPWA